MENVFYSLNYQFEFQKTHSWFNFVTCPGQRFSEANSQQWHATIQLAISMVSSTRLAFRYMLVTILKHILCLQASRLAKVCTYFQEILIFCQRGGNHSQKYGRGN
jgi:hypothetical protein